MADELHAFLEAAAIPSPYILAGHSIGGLVAMVYAARHPDQVAALALIDSTHPDFQQHFFQTRILSQQLAWRWRAFRERITPLGVRRLISDLGFGSVNKGARRDYPDDFVAHGRALMLDSKNCHTDIAEMLAFERTCEEARPAMRNIPAVPMTVLSSSEHDPNVEAGSDNDVLRSRWYITWRALQDNLAGLVPGTIHVIAPAAGHYINRDDPDLVVRILRDLAGRVRACAEPGA
jgi:pimeloyl-ACP methyl ester carboxylesterase